MVDIVVIGSLNMDLVVKVPRMPGPGETLSGGNLMTIPGGKGANQATAAAKLGNRVAMLGCVGRDAFGTRLINDLISVGVDTGHIRVSGEAATGAAIILVDAKGENSIVLSPGANHQVLPEDIHKAEALVGEAKIILLQLEIPLANIYQAVELASKHHIPVILNPAPAQALPENLLKCVSYLIPNETEAGLLTGIEVNDLRSAEAAARKLLSQGVGTVVITLGDKGAFVASGEYAEHIPAEHVEVVDSTAAGDAFIGGFASAITHGCSLRDAVRYAVCAGTLTVQKFGAQTSLPTASEVQAYYDEGRNDKEN